MNDSDKKEKLEDIDGSVGLLAEFWEFLKENKKFWMIPIVIVILLFGLLIMLGGSSAAPFIYTLF